MWNKTKYDSDAHETNKKRGGWGKPGFPGDFCPRPWRRFSGPATLCDRDFQTWTLLQSGEVRLFWKPLISFQKKKLLQSLNEIA